MNHNSLVYRRAMRRKHIERKKRIIKEQNNYWHYEYEGMLAKQKIHCGCGMCSRYHKTNNKARRRLIHGNYAPSYNPSRKDRRRLDSMQENCRSSFSDRSAN